MRGKIHRIKGLMLSMFITAGICAGCGGDFAGLSREGAASGGAVSGGAVSEGAVSGGAVWKEAVSGGAVSGQALSPENGGNGREERQNANYCTDTNLYVEGDDESEGYYVVQMQLDGSRKKWLEIPGFVELISVEENGLFYIRNDEYEIDTLCRIPIEKGGDGFDVVRTDQVEEISSGFSWSFPTAGIESVCVDSQYIVYTVGFDVVKYDRRLKKVVSQMKIDSATLDVRKCGNYFVLWDGWNDTKALYYQGRDEKSWKKIESGLGIYEEGAVFGKDVFFYETDDDGDIYLCDLRKAGIKKFISEEQLERACTGLAGLKQLEFCGVQDMWYEGGRLYVQCEAAWMQGKSTIWHIFCSASHQRRPGSVMKKRPRSVCLPWAGPGRESLSPDRTTIGAASGQRCNMRSSTMPSVTVS